MADTSRHRAMQRLAEQGRSADARRADLTATFQALTDASADSNADDEHDPEGATIAFERAQLRALIDQAQAQLDEVALALVRLDEGTYGVCERCGAKISDGRLAARPVARTCVGCGHPG